LLNNFLVVDKPKLSNHSNSEGIGINLPQKLIQRVVRSSLKQAHSSAGITKLSGEKFFI